MPTKRGKVFWSRVAVVVPIWFLWTVLNWFPTSFPWDNGVYGHGVVGKWRYDPVYVYRGFVRTYPPITPPEKWRFDGLALCWNILLGVAVTGVALGMHELRLRALRPDLMRYDEPDTRSDPEDPQAGATPVWFIAWVFAFLFFFMACVTHAVVEEYEAYPAAGLPQRRTNQGTDIRPALAVIKHVYPYGGKWGCVAVFAVPGLLLAAAGTWVAFRPERKKPHGG